MPREEGPWGNEGRDDAPFREPLSLDDAHDSPNNPPDATREPEDLDDAEVSSADSRIGTTDLEEDASPEPDDFPAVVNQPSEEPVAATIEPEASPEQPGREPREDRELEAIEAAMDEPPEDRVPPLILVSAVVGLVVGLFVWGSLAISVLSSTEDVIGDLSNSPNAFGEEAADLVLDCGDEDPPEFLSADQRSAFEERCASPTPEATATPPPPDPALNRANCDAIRGTDYRSVQEREWFLGNCVESQ